MDHRGILFCCALWMLLCRSTGHYVFHLAKLLGKEDKFFSLLEASAQEARTSVQALVNLSSALDKPLPVMDEFALLEEEG